jgi:hypothetical protein
MARVKTEADGRCDDCTHYHYSPATMYDRNGDPGSPAEYDCDLDWECPDLDDCDEVCWSCTAECDDRIEE